MAEIAMGRQFGDFPMPREDRQLGRVYVHPVLQSVRCPMTLQMKTRDPILGAYRHVGPAVFHFDLPVGRDPAGAPVGGIQDDESQWGGLTRLNERKNGY